MRGLLATTFWVRAVTLCLALPESTPGIVVTENGVITGRRSSEGNNVWEFLGIPYAQPPLGDLRFAAPQSYRRRGPFNATQFVRIHFENK
jgi:cholinesterase